MADGLFCHRYCLHIEPYRIAALQDRLRLAELGSEWEGLSQRLPSATLHNLVQFGDVAEAQKIAEYAFGFTTANEKEKQLTVILQGAGQGTSAVVSAATAREGQERLTEALGSAPFSLIHRSSLWYLVNFGIDLIVLLPKQDAYLRQLDGEICIPGMVRVPLTRDPIDFATSLVAQAAAHWLRLFALTDTTPISGFAESNSNAANPLAHEVSEKILDAVASVVGSSAAHRLLCELEVHSEEKERVGVNLRAVERAYYSLTPLLPCLNAHDFAMNYFPGARQYEKYRGGAGAGQAQ